jgi:16S rRNA (guanine527-N7)-methyltransferase
VTEPSPRLRAAFAEAARLGILGSDIGIAIEHARRFGRALRPTGALLDLGSGAGLPGLVLAVDDEQLHVVLLDASERRTDLLRRAVGRLGVADRVEVVCERAEVFGRRPAVRGTFPAVVARAFGPPATVAECAAPLLTTGGQLLVSEPPIDPTSEPASRWPAEELAQLGLVADDRQPPYLASFRQVERCPERYPRRRLRPPLF